MLKFSANLTMMFTNIPDPLDRIQAAADAGFGAVEYIFVYDMPVDELGAAIDRAGVETSIVNIAVGEGVAMGPLVAAAPGKQEAFKENLDAAKTYCQRLRPVGLVVPAFTPPKGVERTDAMPVFKENMKRAADEMGEMGIKVLIEALNPAIRPNSILTTTADVKEVLDEINHPNLGLEYDAFHMYVTEGNMIETVESHLGLIGNILIADVPGRGEPGSGEVDYQAFLKALDEMGYGNWVACEYEPTGDTLATLGWLQNWRSS